MKIVGIIAEYNPFHMGHHYHIEQTRMQTGADYVICVMSGNFMQRGMPAFANKWVRAQMALAGGADAVFELPFLYATQSAEGFSSGGVKALTALGIDILSFGSESGDIAALQSCADALLLHEDEISREIKDALTDGIPYAAARAQAAQACIGSGSALLRSPNNILGIEYLMALKKEKSHAVPFTIRRKGQAYNDTKIMSDMPGATALRAAMEKGEDVAKFIPSGSLPHLLEQAVCAETYLRLLLYKLRMMRVEDIAEICDVSEGLEFKIKKAAGVPHESLAGLIQSIKSKRYSYTRISRILLYCLFDITKVVIKRANAEFFPGLRLLGYRAQSAGVLSALSARSRVPIVSKAADIPQHFLFDADILASDIYALLFTPPLPSGMDYTQKLIVCT